MDLTIVTSCHNYGQYLNEWAQSICRLTLKPTAVVIVDNGSTDSTAVQAYDAVKLLGNAGIAAITYTIPRTDFGSARNAAVAHSATEWVMHLDADDMLMPHCLEDAALLAPQADIIALGYERSGDLAAGPNNRRRIYSDTTGRQALDAVAPASGVSPFRRALWERKPYRTDMQGGWDTALWIGFALMGARFKATKRPCFWYRQHADSVFNTRRVNVRKSALVGAKLQSLRQNHNGVSILVPWCSTNDNARIAAVDYVKRFYRDAFPDAEFIVGEWNMQPWNKGEAVRNALEQASGETLIVADADCAIDPEALREVVRLVQLGQAPWAIPHKLVYRLNEARTAELYRTGELPDVAQVDKKLDVVRFPYEGFAGGGIFVVDRAAYDATGGIPAWFHGWGAEDEALALIFDTLLGPAVRLDYPLWHLWHPVGPRARHADYRRNRGIHAQFVRAARDPDEMWQLLKTANKLASLSGVSVREAGKRSVDIEAVQDAARLQTLEIRAAQKVRNEEANRLRQHSYDEQRLAEAGRRTKGKG